MTYVITQACVDVLDKACIDECPVDCIYEGDRMLYIHPDECVDCGACEPVCPVEAIYYEDDVPDKWKDFYNANVEFFSDLGSPGGAAKTGKIAKDLLDIVWTGPERAAALTVLSAALAQLGDDASRAGQTSPDVRLHVVACQAQHLAGDAWGLLTVNGGADAPLPQALGLASSVSGVRRALETPEAQP